VLNDAEERETLAGYQMTRDAVARQMLDVADAIGGHRWTDAEIPSLLLQLNAAANDGRTRDPVRARHRTRHLIVGRRRHLVPPDGDVGPAVRRERLRG
jgi:hypothetical protein